MARRLRNRNSKRTGDLVFLLKYKVTGSFVREEKIIACDLVRWHGVKDEDEDDEDGSQRDSEGN